MFVAWQRRRRDGPLVERDRDPVTETERAGRRDNNHNPWHGQYFRIVFQIKDYQLPCAFLHTRGGRTPLPPTCVCVGVDAGIYYVGVCMCVHKLYYTRRTMYCFKIMSSRTRTHAHTDTRTQAHAHLYGCFISPGYGNVFDTLVRCPSIYFKMR